MLWIIAAFVAGVVAGHFVPKLYTYLSTAETDVANKLK